MSGQVGMMSKRVTSAHARQRKHRDDHPGHVLRLHRFAGVHGGRGLGVEDVLVELRLDTAGDDLGDAYANGERSARSAAAKPDIAALVASRRQCWKRPRGRSAEPVNRMWPDWRSRICGTTRRVEQDRRAEVDLQRRVDI